MSLKRFGQVPFSRVAASVKRRRVSTPLKPFVRSFSVTFEDLLPKLRTKTVKPQQSEERQTSLADSAVAPEEVTPADLYTQLHQIKKSNSLAKRDVDQAVFDVIARAESSSSPWTKSETQTFYRRCIATLAEQGRNGTALELLTRMQSRECEPDLPTLQLLIKACVPFDDVVRAMTLYKRAKVLAKQENSVAAHTRAFVSLIEVCAHGHAISSAEAAFEEYIEEGGDLLKNDVICAMAPVYSRAILRGGKDSERSLQRLRDLLSIAATLHLDLKSSDCADIVKAFIAVGAFDEADKVLQTVLTLHGFDLIIGQMRLRKILKQIELRLLKEKEDYVGERDDAGKGVDELLDEARQVWSKITKHLVDQNIESADAEMERELRFSADTFARCALAAKGKRGDWRAVVPDIEPLINFSSCPDVMTPIQAVKSERHSSATMLDLYPFTPELSLFLLRFVFAEKQDLLRDLCDNSEATLLINLGKVAPEERHTVKTMRLDAVFGELRKWSPELQYRVNKRVGRLVVRREDLNDFLEDFDAKEIGKIE
jgi:hypothetical protein